MFQLLSIKDKTILILGKAMKPQHRAAAPIDKGFRLAIGMRKSGKPRTEGIVPHLGKWNKSRAMYDGGFGDPKTPAYDHNINDTKYSISPLTPRKGYETAYRVGAQSPNGNETLGSVRNPREGVRMARAHHDKHFGNKVNED